MTDKVKQVIVIRKDLNMRKGKMVAQGCHASISFLTNKIREQIRRSESTFSEMQQHVSFEFVLSDVEKAWISGTFFKVCVGVDTEQELLDILEKARNMGVEAQLITDQGHTEFNGIPTNTCLALGPDYSNKIDLITGNLKLL